MHDMMMKKKLSFVLVFAFILLLLLSKSKATSVIITSAPTIVVVEEEEELGDRGGKVAETASGSYEQLVQDRNLQSGNRQCPSNISLVLNHEKDQAFNIKLPSGLVDANGDCKAADNFVPQKLPMKNFGRAISTLAVVLSESTVMEHSTHLTGDLPDGAFQCPASSPPFYINTINTAEGTTSTAFERISITSLKEPITLLLRMALERIGVPADTLDEAFKSRNKGDEWVATRQALNENAWRVQAAMRPLEMTFALILGAKTASEDGVGSVLGLFNDACFYIGGKQSLSSVMGKIKNLVDALIPLARRARFPRFDLPVPDFFALHRPCTINNNNMKKAAVNQLTLERIISGADVVNRSEEERGEKFAVKLNGGKDVCARVNITRFIEVEKELNLTSSSRNININTNNTNNSTTKNTLLSGPYVVNLVNEMIDMFERFGAGSGLFKRLRADEEVAGYFPEILQTLARFEFKANILVGSVDLSNCTTTTAGNNNNSNITAKIVLINRPSIMLDCGGGRTNSTCISQKNTDVLFHHPPRATPINNNDDTIEAPNTARQVFDESSLLLVPENQTDSCIFSTLKPFS